jgi:hypothetical protein
MEESQNSNPKWVICNCNNCSGHLEFDAANAGTTVKCPHCEIETLLFIPPISTENSSEQKSNPQLTVFSMPKSIIGWLIAILLLGIIVWVGAQKSKEFNSPKPESEWQQKHRLQSEAASGVLAECSNHVVGITRVIDSFVDDLDSDPHKWKGDVTVEFINQIGGVDRTNIPFIFSTDTGFDGVLHVYCHYDWQKASGIYPTQKLKAQIDGAFGIKLGAPLQSDCKILSSELNKHDGYIVVKIIPPQPNAAFDDYQVELDPRNQLVSFISAYGKVTDEINSDTTDGLLKAIRDHYGNETSYRSDGDFRLYDWNQDNRYLGLTIVSGTPSFSCYDCQLYQPIKTTVDKTGL